MISSRLAKRIAVAVVVVAVAIGAALAAVTLLITDATVTATAIGEIRAVTGLNPALHGDTKVSLFPSGTVAFRKVTLRENDDATPAMVADELVVRMKFFPLLLGRIEIADLSLLRPTITIAYGADGRSNWSGLIDKLANNQQLDQDDTFSEIKISEGTITLQAPNGLNETLRDAEFLLAWPLLSKGFNASGRFVWRDEPVDASLTLADFASAISGARSGVKLRATSKALKTAFDGNVSTRPSVKIEGALSAESGSLRDVVRWTGRQQLPDGGFGRFTLKAQTNVIGGTVALSGVNMNLDGNAVEGVFSLTTDTRRALQGTIAAEKLDLTPYISTLQFLTGQGEWDTGPVKLDWLDGSDVDFRLSAAQVTIAAAKLGRTAVAANLRNRRFEVTVGESQAYGGVIKGTLAVTSKAPNADVQAQLQFNDVDLEPALNQLFGTRRLEGIGNIAFAVEGTGDSVMAITRTLNGQAALTGRKGALTGINVEQLLRRLERRPLSGAAEFRSGRTSYDRLAVLLKVTNGVVEVEDVNIEGAAVRLAVGGSASIPARDLDLKGTASLISASTTAATFDLPFIVQGSFDNPIILPDPQSLIRRSGAAAPLLDTAQNRRARDAVLQAIQRLTGGLPVSVPSVPADAATAEKPAP